MPSFLCKAYHRQPSLSFLEASSLFKDPLKRHSRYNDFRRHWVSEISNCYGKTVQSWEQVNTNSETDEITDPLYGFLLCLCWTHAELPENFSFGFTVVHNSTLGKILEIQLTLISARRAKDCCRSPLLVAFRIPDLVYPIDVPFLSSIRVYLLGCQYGKPSWGLRLVCLFSFFSFFFFPYR